MREGFAIVPGVLAAGEIAALLAAIGDPAAAGIRNLLARVPEVRALADSPALRALVEPVLGVDAIPVRGILFDKSPAANWKVPWHQDLTIAVEQRAEVAGYGPWSVKDGIHHVQPPAQVLEQMIAVRLHLDDCDAGNGALRVIPGSHVCGRLSAAQTQAMVQSTAGVVCEVGAGGALLMRPLLLHASSPAASPRHRRVIQIEYAACELPAALAWHAGAQRAN